MLRIVKPAPPRVQAFWADHETWRVRCEGCGGIVHYHLAREPHETLWTRAPCTRPDSPFKADGYVLIPPTEPRPAPAGTGRRRALPAPMPLRATLEKLVHVRRSH